MARCGPTLKTKSNIDKVGRYGGWRVYIPTKMVADSAFTELFQAGSGVELELDEEKGMLIVRPAAAPKTAKPKGKRNR